MFDSTDNIVSFFSSSTLWITLMILFLVSNVKNLPFVFHIRCAHPLLTAYLRKKTHHIVPSQPNTTTPTIFLPSITTTYCPLLEADYNLHKSNSTYFTDLDASRSHLMTYLCWDGLAAVNKAMEEEGKTGRINIFIGAVQTSYKKQIGLFQKYEVWSRILTWDQKWVFIVSYFVKAGSVKPRAFVDRGMSGDGDGGAAAGGKAEPVIYATSVSKYVFKKDRLTIPPERILGAAGLLGEGELAQRVEEGRVRGMKYAAAWTVMEGLHDELLSKEEVVDGVVALGHFSDI